MANDYLGHSFKIIGKVVEGKKLGRSLGYPTANLKVEDPFKIIPCDGVYAVKVELNRNLYDGMVNIGSRPTIKEDSKERSIEVNIFDFDREIYDEHLTLHIEYRIRDEIKFKNLTELKDQLEKDRLVCLELLRK